MNIDLTTINLCPGQGRSKPETTFSVDPSTQEQVIIPEDGYVFSSGTVAAVDSTIDSNIVPGNIKTGISILGVQGTVNPQKPEETFTVNPSTQAQTVTPESGHVFSSGTVAAVDSTIDQNIVSSNIKSGITILGVQGNVNPQKPEETFSITPRISDLILTPQEGYVFSSGVVAAVTSEIDANIVPENIRTGVSILGVTGNVSPAKSEETFTVNPSTQAQTVTPESGHVFSSGVVTAVTSSIDQNIVPGNIKSGVTILGVQGTVNPQKPEETFSITPRISDLIVTPQEGYVFSSGVVAAVTSEIDANIVPENIRTGVSILGVTGNVSPAKSEETFTVNPSTQAQTITPQSGYTFSSGTVAAVDSTIDSNIQAANIKDGVTILGVLGTYTGGVTPTGTISIGSNGTYDVTAYASAQVAVGGTDYRNQNGTVTGLADLGWDADSIGYYQANALHYPWQNADYTVTQANKDLYGVVNKNNKGGYQNNTDMVYVPMFDTTGVTSMRYYFMNFGKIKGIPILDTSSVTDMNGMFSRCTSLITIPLLDTGSVTDMPTMFYECNSLTTVPVLDTSKVTNMVNMFGYCSSLKTIPLLDTSAAENMGSMFSKCNSLTTIPLLNTSNVTNMGNMFDSCSNLTTIPLLDTSKVTNMNSMFQYCSKLTTIPALDTSSVTNMYRMFFNCSKLTTIPALDTSSVTNMEEMFYYCSNLTTVNGIDFSSLTAAPSRFMHYGGQNVTRFIVNGKIDFSWSDDFGLARLTSIDFDSVKSILQAMSRTTNANAKTMKLNRVMADQNGQLAALIADCQDKGWTIIGLAIPTGDPVIHYTSKDGNVVAPKQLPSGLTVVSNVYQDGAGTITFNTYPSEIGQYMYQGKTQLDTIEIPDEVGSIGYAAFADGCGITSITIPSNVKSIDSYAFSGATSLVEVVMESAVPPTMGNGVFQGHNANLVIRVPLSAVDTYKAASYWGDYASLIVGYE